MLSPPEGEPEPTGLRPLWGEELWGEAMHEQLGLQLELRVFWDAGRKNWLIHSVWNGKTVEITRALTRAPIDATDAALLARCLARGIEALIPWDH